ncbi:efflux RND transporter periplasmic adaptor subunit [Adhaeribacter radiodurans]|uniref:Efflux RND transporter periplasmic adaptor subunit n=1 Tax=Adhaeribacter radiodurans TaxID=2745197 RepID=A0A7L7L9X6_9BACT|nr:efflux RND transporter periplasmic adaptor subunit [Adhaeribacter radiodurans]QMU29553.1 efflux RND transporter periplasmic adaptor subunit [Adhaeribacter radiodurans]
MKNILMGSCLIMATAFFSGGCQQSHGEIEKSDLGFCLSDTISSMIKLDTARVQEVQNELKLSGKVTFDEQKVFKIYPLVGGNVIDVKAELGDQVKQGQVLAVIHSSEIADFEQQLTNAQSNLLLADKNLSTAEDMYKSGLTSERDYVIAQKEKSKAQAEVKRINEIFKIYNIGKASDYVVKAPASGFLVEKKINRDMQIRPDNTDNIFTISNLNDIWVLANVYETDIAKIKEGYKATISVLSYPDKVFTGKVDKIYNVLDPETRVMKVRIKLDNSDFALKPEMFANVTIHYPEDKHMVAVPARSVIFDKNRNFIMVYRKRCDIDTRPVELYKTVNQTAYVQTGLKPGETVISDYQLLVYDALND